jgi:hypothetical protein
MAPLTHVTVIAPPERRTPVDAADGVEPGGGPLYVTADEVRRIKYSHTTIRSIGRGDLILCNMDGEPVASVDLAAAPVELEGGRLPVKARKAPSDKKGGK